MLSVIIAKPTKMCPAQCSYCSAFTQSKEKWDFEEFKHIFDKISSHLPDNSRSTWIWHGGEPLLMPVDFYERAFEYAKEKKPNLEMAMQTNLLLYDSKKWKNILSKMCNNSLSTSFDPDMTGRIYKGSAQNYTNVFFEKLQEVKDDGFNVSIIGTFTSEMYEKDLHMRFYDMSKSFGSQSFGLRFNYRYPAGKAKGKGDFITVDDYASLLIDVYDKWIKEVPPFVVVPHYQLIEKILNPETFENRCPWTNQCSGKFIGLETNGDIYNCGCFADVGDDKYKFGNIKKQTIDEILSSKPARELRRRKIKLPNECKDCEEYNICKGGCPRDSVLFGGGIYEKTHYCLAWKKLIKRIKESIRKGEAYRLIRSFKNLDNAYKKLGALDKENFNDEDNNQIDAFNFCGL